MKYMWMSLLLLSGCSFTIGRNLVLSEGNIICTPCAGFKREGGSVSGATSITGLGIMWGNSALKIEFFWEE